MRSAVREKLGSTDHRPASSSEVQSNGVNSSCPSNAPPQTRFLVVPGLVRKWLAENYNVALPGRVKVLDGPSEVTSLERIDEVIRPARRSHFPTSRRCSEMVG